MESALIPHDDRESGRREERGEGLELDEDKNSENPLEENSSQPMINLIGSAEEVVEGDQETPNVATGVVGEDEDGVSDADIEGDQDRNDEILHNVQTIHQTIDDLNHHHHHHQEHHHHHHHHHQQQQQQHDQEEHQQPLGEVSAVALEGRKKQRGARGTKRARKPSTICPVEGCHGWKELGGYCTTHGGGRRCQVDGCRKRDQGQGKCIAHGAPIRTCGHAGCKNRVNLFGFCQRHGGYSLCREAGCDARSAAGGYCLAHGGGRCHMRTPRRCQKKVVRFHQYCTDHIYLESSMQRPAPSQQTTVSLSIGEGDLHNKSSVPAFVTDADSNLETEHVHNKSSHTHPDDFENDASRGIDPSLGDGNLNSHHQQAMSTEMVHQLE